jgi:hypothetical protein
MSSPHPPTTRSDPPTGQDWTPRERVLLAVGLVVLVLVVYGKTLDVPLGRAVSSVAGDRGRRSNPLYGAAKAGLSVYLQGLRNRLAPLGVHVMTVKPGFVDTRMLRGRGRATRFLAASPERVARSVRRGLARRRNTIYTPWFWRPIMWLVRSVPEAVFKRMKL